jgi:hypothetical protein
MVVLPAPERPVNHKVKPRCSLSIGIPFCEIIYRLCTGVPVYMPGPSSSGLTNGAAGSYGLVAGFHQDLADGGMIRN